VRHLVPDGLDAVEHLRGEAALLGNRHAHVVAST
jgi:hypothetical protein